MKYKASWDLTTIIATAFIIMLGVFFAYDSIPGMPFYITHFVIPWPIGFLLLITIGITYLFAPKYYRIENGNVIIVRPLSNIILPFNEILSAEESKDLKFFNTIRTFGSGGLFGYFGKCWNSRIGSFSLYGTQRKNWILITSSKGEKYIITPDDKGMLEEINKAIA